MPTCESVNRCVCVTHTVWPQDQKHPHTSLQFPPPPHLPSLDFRHHPKSMSIAQSQGTGDVEMGVVRLDLHTLPGIP